MYGKDHCHKSLWKASLAGLLSDHETWILPIIEAVLLSDDVDRDVVPF